MGNPDLPIGVFDSGLGGLTVLKALHELLPQENFLYLGDTARLPYGNKSPATILNYLKQNVHFFERTEVKAVVVACNSASSVLSGLGPTSVPVYGVIEPGAQKAKEKSQLGRIGVLGTRATISQRAYVKALHDIDPKLQVFQQACPLLVPLVEEGWDDDPLTNLVIYRYLTQILQSGIDVLILGCTHYPVLKSTFSKVAGPHIQMVDSAEVVAEKVKEDLASGRIPARAHSAKGGVRILTTDRNETFQQIAQRLMQPYVISSLEQVDITVLEHPASISS